MKKKQTVILRVTNEQREYLEKACVLLGDMRPDGANSVTLTEVVTILLTMGREKFDRQYGNPLEYKTKKKTKSAS